MLRFTAAAAAFALSLAAQASCGSAFCTVNNNWSSQGVWTDPGTRLDLRYEYIRQDQPLHGTDKVGVGQIPQHHDEVKTINRNWLASLDYTFNQDWGVSATLPIQDRDHTHIHNHRGQQLIETWNYTEVGDMRVVGRRQWHSENLDKQTLDTYGINFGLKLPTGATDVRKRSAR